MNYRDVNLSLFQIVRLGVLGGTWVVWFALVITYFSGRFVLRLFNVITRAKGVGS